MSSVLIALPPVAVPAALWPVGMACGVGAWAAYAYAWQRAQLAAIAASQPRRLASRHVPSDFDARRN